MKKVNKQVILKLKDQLSGQQSVISKKVPTLGLHAMNLS